MPYRVLKCHLSNLVEFLKLTCAAIAGGLITALELSLEPKFSLAFIAEEAVANVDNLQTRLTVCLLLDMLVGTIDYEEPHLLKSSTKNSSFCVVMHCWRS